MQLILVIYKIHPIILLNLFISSVQFSNSVVFTLCHPIDCSAPGFPVCHQLLELHTNSCPLSWWCHPTISSFVVSSSSWLQSYSATGSFLMSQFFASGDQSMGASASASVFSMNIQDFFPLELSDLISLKSKGLSRVPTPQFKSINSLVLSFLYSPTHIHTWLLEKP